VDGFDHPTHDEPSARNRLAMRKHHRQRGLFSASATNANTSSAGRSMWMLPPPFATLPSVYHRRERLEEAALLRTSERGLQGPRSTCLGICDLRRA